jgi:hypothetical protein
MNPVTPQDTKRAEIREHGLFGRQLEPVFRGKMGKLLALALGAVPLGISFYWMFTYSGPYRYLAELEQKWIGSYERNLTFLLVFSGLFLGLLFGLTGIAVAIKLLFRGAERPVPGMPTAPMATPGIAPTAIPQPAIQLSERYQRNVRYAVMFATPLILFGMGAYSYYNGTQVGSLQQLSVADFQSGKLQSHIVYADVRGHLSGHYISKNDYLYIPMASQKNAASPVQLLVGVNDSEKRKYLHREADGTFRVRGIADKGVEGDVKYAFEKNGTSMADTIWVVHAGRAPSDDRMMGLSVMGFGVVLAGLLFAWQSYQKRKRAALQPVHETA